MPAPTKIETASQWSSPVLLVGPQRTGSTLVGRILASAPRSAFTVNGKILYYLLHWVRDDASDLERGHFRADEIVHALTRKPILGVGDGFLDSHVAPILFELGRHLADSSPGLLDRSTLIREAIGQVYRGIEAEPAVWGDTYNEYVLHLPEIARIYPRARYVATLRDPAAAGCSMRRAFAARAWCPSDLERATAKYLQWEAAWRSFARRCAPADVLEIDYDDLLADPVTTLRALAAFVGLAPGSLEPCAAWIASADDARAAILGPPAPATT
jgi:hypothetical protein